MELKRRMSYLIFLLLKTKIVHVCYFAIGKFSKAEQAFLQFISFSEQPEEGYYALSALHRHRRFFDRALQQIDRALNLKPEKLEYQVQKSLIQSESQGHEALTPDLVHQISGLEREVGTQSKNVILRTFLGCTLTDVQRYRDALAQLESVLMVNPPQPTTTGNS